MSDTPARRRVVEASPRRPTVELQAIHVIVERDENPDASYLDQPEFADHKKAYKRGDFGFLRVRAEAELLVGDAAQVIGGVGTGGIERNLVDSDPDLEDEIGEIAAEEYVELRKVLKTIGVPTAQLPGDLDSRWIEWRT